MNDERLAARLRKKDEKALEETVRRFTPLTASIIYNVSKGTLTKEDIEEVTADVFITLWNNTEKIIPEKLKGYICCIARTRALNKIESVKKGVIISLDDDDFKEELEDDFSIADETETKDVQSELKNIIDSLEEPERTIMIRYYFYYQTTSKISEIMNINASTVKTKLKRTREKIKEILLKGGYSL